MRFMVLVLAFASASARGAEWTPPENPNPQAILQEAQRDAAAKRYETALAKHLWFHRNALSIQPALAGVRLSFALSYWHELAEEYPPAMTKLKEIRDQAARKVMVGQDVRESFHDMSAINRTLGEEALTKETFEVLDVKNRKAAKEVFGLAQPALVQGKAYELYAKYVEPERDFSRIAQHYRQGKRMAEDPRFGDRHLDYVNKKFANDATTLVAILAVNERNAEAAKIAILAKEELDDSTFHSELSDALKGIVPAPWP